MRDLEDTVTQFSPEYNLSNPIFRFLRAWDFNPPKEIFGDPLDNPFNQMFNGGGGGFQDNGFYGNLTPAKNDEISYNQENSTWGKEVGLSQGYIDGTINVDGNLVLSRFRAPDIEPNGAVHMNEEWYNIHSRESMMNNHIPLQSEDLTDLVDWSAIRWAFDNLVSYQKPQEEIHGYKVVEWTKRT